MLLLSPWLSYEINYRITCRNRFLLITRLIIGLVKTVIEKINNGNISSKNDKFMLAMTSSQIHNDGIKILTFKILSCKSLNRERCQSCIYIVK